MTKIGQKMAELDIAEGNIPGAIEATRAILTLEPQNPARYYQLGILFTAAEQNENALQAYTAALTLSADIRRGREHNVANPALQGSQSFTMA